MSTATLHRPNGARVEGHDSDDLPHIVDAREHGRMRYNIVEALRMAHPDARKEGLEGETSSELLRRAGRYSSGMMIPLDAPLRESYDLTSTTGAGSITTALMTLADALRNKSICARMGARMGDFRGDRSGLVALPVKRSPATVSWVAENTPPSASSPMLIQQVQSTPHTAMVYTDTTRRILKTGPSDFGGFVIDDLTTGIASAIDAAALNGTGNSNQPLGLAQIPWTSFAFSSGTPTYKGLTAMKLIAGQANVDSAGDARMGWVTSSAGREAIEQCDLGGGTTTGRYAWKSRVDRDDATGELVTIESVLGAPAAATENIPSGMSGAGLTNATMLFYGNFRHMLIQLYGAVHVLANPYTFDASGSVRYSASQDIDVMFQYPLISFVSAPIVAPNP
jgi:hypothetical protein